MDPTCPRCSSVEDPVLIGGIELGADGSSDERWLALVRCRSCRAAAVQYYEESRRGRLDQEAVNRSSSPVDDETAARFELLLTACPAQRSEQCQCVAHRLLRSGLSLHELLWDPGDQHTDNRSRV